MAEQTGNGAVPAAAAPVGVTGGDAGAIAGTNGSSPPERPSWLPPTDNRFWDPEKGFDGEKAYHAQRELQSAFGRRVTEMGAPAIRALVEQVPDELKEAWGQQYRENLVKDENFLKEVIEPRLPKPPEAYDLAEGALAEGINLDKEGELYKRFEEFSRKTGLSNEAYNELIGMGAALYQSVVPPPLTEEQKISELGERVKAIGPDYDARLTKTVQAARNAIPETLRSDLQDLMQLIVKPGQFLALEALVNGRGREQPTPDTRRTEPPPLLTAEELQRMKADPRNWRDKDPAWIRKISEGFQKLYGDTV